MSGRGHMMTRLRVHLIGHSSHIISSQLDTIGRQSNSLKDITHYHVSAYKEIIGGHLQFETYAHAFQVSNYSTVLRFTVQ